MLYISKVCALSCYDHVVISLAKNPRLGDWSCILLSKNWMACMVSNCPNRHRLLRCEESTTKQNRQCQYRWVKLLISFSTASKKQASTSRVITSLQQQQCHKPSNRNADPLVPRRTSFVSYTLAGLHLVSFVSLRRTFQNGSMEMATQIVALNAQNYLVWRIGTCWWLLSKEYEC